MSDISEFSYSNNTFSKTDSINPLPSITGACGGLFSSISGISLNEDSGSIQLSSSDIGDYVITYSISDGVNVETSTQNITITS